MHHYADYDARDASRAELAANSTWHAFLDIEKNSVASERSEIYLSADACLVASGAPQGASAASVAGAACASSSDSAAGVFEMRTYQLELGIQSRSEAHRPHGGGFAFEACVGSG